MGKKRPPPKAKGRIDKPIAPPWAPSNPEVAARVRAILQPQFTDADRAAAERETAAAIAASKLVSSNVAGTGAAEVDRMVAAEHAAVQMRIVENFTEAVKAPIAVPPKATPKRDWVGLALAVVIVGGAIVWRLHITDPRIQSLRSDIASLGRRYHMALADRARIEGIADDTHAANKLLLDENSALALQNEVEVLRWSDDEASMHAASRDIARASAVIQRAQALDTLNDRDQAAAVIKALQRAGQRLKSQ